VFIEALVNSRAFPSASACPGESKFFAIFFVDVRENMAGMASQIGGKNLRLRLFPGDLGIQLPQVLTYGRGMEGMASRRCFRSTFVT
jgi:hypothetical protein